MASTPSTSLRLELMATGDQSGTWGDTTNTNLGTLLEQAITGVLSVAQGDVANLTLTNTDYVSNQARNAVVNLTGAMTSGRNVVVPTANKLYLIKNSTTGGFAVTVKTSAGSGVAIAAGTAQWVYCDGTNVVQGLSGTMAAQAASSVAITGGSITGLTTFSITSGGAAIGGASTITGSGAGTLLTMTSTDAGATAGPSLDLYRNSGTPAANDILGQVLFNGADSTPSKQEYGSIEAVIQTATSGSEDGVLDFYATRGGTRTRIMSLGANIIATRGLIQGYTTTATAAGTTTLTVNSTQQQFFTGATTQTVVLPVTSTLTLGQSYEIVNNSTGAVTVQSSGANTIAVLPAGTSLEFAVILTSGTSAASWSVKAGVAAALKSATTVVGVGAATAPTAGQVLTATSSTAATWQAASGGWDFTGQTLESPSRAANNTAYQNTTGKPIIVYQTITWQGTSQSGFSLSADNSTWVTIGLNDTGATSQGTYIIPPNYYYRVHAGSSGTVNFWREWR